VACAIAGEADFLVSTDHDIFALGELMQVRMLMPHPFVDAVWGATPRPEPSGAS